MILFLVSIVILFLVLAWGIPAVLASLYGAPWLPTPKDSVERMLELARVKKGEVVYDLGSGFGRISIAAARNFGARSVGIEIDPIKVWASRLVIFFLGLSDRVKIIRGNFFKTDLSRADVVTCFLLHPTNKKLMSKLESELKPGTRIVSHSFTFPGWQMVKKDSKKPLFLYIMGRHL